MKSLSEVSNEKNTITREDREPAVCHSSIAELVRLAHFIETLSISDYHRVSPHVRHALDHFDALISGLENGVIEYDRRARNPETEMDPRVGRIRIDKALAGLRRIVREDLGSLSIDVRVLVDPALPAVTVLSTIDREVIFLASHLTHHLALIRAAFADRKDFLGSSFGKSPGTIAFERTRS
jgi:hypothetical protein